MEQSLQHMLLNFNKTKVKFREQSADILGLHDITDRLHGVSKTVDIDLFVYHFIGPSIYCTHDSNLNIL